MKTLITSLGLLLSTSLMAATLEVSVTTRGIKADAIKEAHIGFISTNPLCHVINPVMPIPVPRQERFQARVSVVGEKAVITANTKFPGSGFCGFRLSGVSLDFKDPKGRWVNLSSTADDDVNKSDAVLLEILKQPHKEFVVTCEGRTCQALADGQAQDRYESNLAELYLDAQEVKKSGVVRGKFTLEIKD